MVNTDLLLVNTVDTLFSLVNFRNGVYVIQMDKGGFEEANSGTLRILPADYPKNRSFHEAGEKPPVEAQVSKHKHKHNILLGYDFVDENDTDIVAWDRAIQRRKRTEKTKSVSPPLPDIKQELEEDSEENIRAEVNQSVQSMVEQVSSHWSIVIIHSLSLVNTFSLGNTINPDLLLVNNTHNAFSLVSCVITLFSLVNIAR